MGLLGDCTERPRDVFVHSPFCDLIFDFTEFSFRCVVSDGRPIVFLSLFAS